jgi:serine/threonine-protein kinase
MTTAPYRQARCRLCNAVFAANPPGASVCPRCAALQASRPAAAAAGPISSSEEAIPLAVVTPGDPMIGRQVGPYRIAGVLGRGAMGVVYRAEEDTLHRSVAFKLLTNAKQTARLRFLREARLEAQLNHSNIVPVYQFGELDGMPYIVTELMCGGSLDQRLEKQGLFDPLEAAAVMRDAARGLHFAHKRGVVHRDVKPANMLLDAFGTVKVADFGMAREAEDPLQLTQAGMMVGTPAFIAPELARGSPASPGSDVYALGCSLYFLLTGEPPFNSPVVAQLLRMHLTQPFPDARKKNPKVPAALEAVLQRACEKDPAKRYQTAEEMADALDAVVTGGRQPAAAPAAPPAVPDHQQSTELLRVVDMYKPSMLARPAPGASGDSRSARPVPVAGGGSTTGLPWVVIGLAAVAAVLGGGLAFLFLRR